jgi:signal transduction histidine kinase
VSRRQRRAEAVRAARLQAERLEALRRVAGGVAHSFNNSLTVILGQADLGLLSASEPEAGESFARIREAGERSANLTRHLLWYTGRQHQQRETLRTGAWLRALEPELRALAAHGVSVTLAAPDVPGTVTGDAAQLAAAVLELTRNAVASMPDGSPVLVSLDACRAGEAPAGGPAGTCHRISVSDSGRGIATEHLPKLFEPFYSAGASMPDSGMGLAVAHGVVRAHGGAIAVESAPGRGSTFRVILPADALD